MLRLVRFTPEHFTTLSSWFHSESDVVLWGGPYLSFPLTADQLQAMIDEEPAAPPTRKCWMAENDGILVGHAQLGFDWRNGNARLGRVAISPAERGRGLAVPMLRLVVAEAFAFPEIQRLDLKVHPSNTPAIRSYERIGFVWEGVRRSSTRVGDERWDMAFMSLLRPEWASALAN